MVAWLGPRSSLLLAGSSNQAWEPPYPGGAGHYLVEADVLEPSITKKAEITHRFYI